MSTMPSGGSGTYAPGPNMVCSPEQEKVGTGSIEAIIYPVYSDLRIRATVSIITAIGIFLGFLLNFLVLWTFPCSVLGSADNKPQGWRGIDYGVFGLVFLGIVMIV